MSVLRARPISDGARRRCLYQVRAWHRTTSTGLGCLPPVCRRLLCATGGHACLQDVSERHICCCFGCDCLQDLPEGKVWCVCGRRTRLVRRLQAGALSRPGIVCRPRQQLHGVYRRALRGQPIGNKLHGLSKWPHATAARATFVFQVRAGVYGSLHGRAVRQLCRWPLLQ